MITFANSIHTQRIVNEVSKHAAHTDATREKLITGKRINFAKDDAAGLIVSIKHETKISGNAYAARNLERIEDKLRLADTLLNAIQDYMFDFGDEALRNGSEATTEPWYVSNQRAKDALSAEINIRDAARAVGRFKDEDKNAVLRDLFKDLDVQMGPDQSDVWKIQIGDMSISNDGLKLDYDADGGGLGMWGYAFWPSSDTSHTLMTVIPRGIEIISQKRAEISGAMQSIAHQRSLLSTESINLHAARSRIQDADYAFETAELARSSIKEQMSVSVLSQARVSSEIALQLLRG